MGTRALIHVKEAGKYSDTLVTIYRQYDGCPDGLGEDIKRIIGDSGISNGISNGMEECFNGMGCFAAWLIKELKDKIGNVYIYAPNSKDVGEEFVYTVFKNESTALGVGEVGNVIVDCYVVETI